MKNLFALLIFLSGVFLSSCTVTQEFYFNKDFSGTYKSTIDMSQFIGAIKSLDTSTTGTSDFKDSLNLLLDEANKKLLGTGVSNLKVGWTNNDVMFLSYDFADIDVLNKALNKSVMAKNENGDRKDFVYFEQKGKKLIYNGQSPDDLSDEGKDLGKMKDYYKYKLSFTFERTIKKTDNDKYKISEDRHKATLTAPLFDITKSGFNSKVKFKLK